MQCQNKSKPSKLGKACRMSTIKQMENLIPRRGKTAASQNSKSRVTLGTQTKAPDNW